MKNDILKNKMRIRRKIRSRSMIAGSASRPRISIHKTNKHVYVQCIDDSAQKTLVSVSSLIEKKDADALMLAKKAADSLKEKGISEGVFDRGQYRYHGIVKSIAEEMRKNGIKI